MNHNPYAPPVAAVEDVQPSAPAERPRNVTLAVRLLWLAIFAGLPGAIYGMFNDELPPGVSRAIVTVASLIMYALLYALMSWLIGAAGKGRHWARVTHAVLISLNVLGVVWLAPKVIHNPAFAPLLKSIYNIVVYLLQTAMDVVAVVLLFTPSANAWYKTRPNPDYG